MLFAALTWVTGAAMLGLMLLWYIRQGYVAAAAVLLVLIPQVYARPLLFLFGIDRPFPTNLFRGSEWDLIASALIVPIGWMLLIFIAHLIFFRALLPLGKFIPQAGTKISSKLLMTAVVFTTVCGIVSTGILVLHAGSIGNFMYQVKIEKALSGSYVIREISVIGAIFAAVAIIHFEKIYRTSSAKKKTRTFVWLSALLFTINLAFNYFWGNRYNIAMLLFAAGLSWHWYIHKLNVVKVTVLVLIVGATLQSLKTLREESVSDALNRQVSSSQPFWQNLSISLHFSQFDAFMLALRDAGTAFAFRDGKDFKNGLLAWVPRRLYPEKETFHVGGWFRRVYQPEMINGWPITTMGDWYVNFGGVGIVFGGFLSGLLAALFDGAYRNVKSSAWQATTAPALALLIFDGGVDPGFIQRTVLIMVPVCILASILSITQPNDSDSATKRQRRNLLTT